MLAEMKHRKSHPLEGSFYEGLSVKCLLALFIFICLMIRRYAYTH